jgi:arginine/lysine/ornithine decarboxylase
MVRQSVIIFMTMKFELNTEHIVSVYLSNKYELVSLTNAVTKLSNNYVVI